MSISRDTALRPPADTASTEKNVEQAPFTWAFRAILIVLIAIVIAVLAVIVWALPHGFDLTDEAWADTLIANNRVAVGEAWGFQHLVHWLFELTGSSVLALRWFRLIGYLVISGVLVYVGWAVSRAFGWTMRWWWWVFVAAASQVGTFLAWSFPPRYVSYNELSGWLTEIGAALLVVIIAAGISPERFMSRRWLAVIWAGVGLTLAVLCVAKITAGLALAAVAIVVLIFCGGRLVFWRRLVCLVSGALIGAVALLVSGVPLRAYLGNMAALLFDPALQKLNAHSPSALIHAYAVEIYHTGLQAAPVLSALIVAVLLVALRTSGGQLGSRRFSPALIGTVAAIAVAMIVILLIVQPASDFIIDISRLNSILGVGVVLSLLALRLPTAEQRDRRRRVWRIVLAVCVIIAAPFVAAVGTDNPLPFQLLYATTIWSVTFALGMTIMAVRLSHSRSFIALIPTVVALIATAVSATQVWSDVTVHPYGTVPYAQQQTPTDVKSLAGLRLTKEGASWATWLAATADEQDAQNVPTIAIAQPGALLIFNASSFASPWTSPGWPASSSSIVNGCVTKKPSDLIVLQPGYEKLSDPLVHTISRALKSCGFDFPKDFTIVAKRQSPESAFRTNVWRLNPDR